MTDGLRVWDNREPPRAGRQRAESVSGLMMD